MLTYPDGTTVANPRDVVVWYFGVMNKGRQYEEFVHSSENRASPNRLLVQNWNRAFCIHARGMSWQTVGTYVGEAAEDRLHLSTIPVDADLLGDWSLIEPSLGRVLQPLLELRGVQAANATKLLYQKRPGLIPMLDSRFCEVLAIESPRGLPETLRAIRHVRHALTHNGNLQVLQDLQAWIAGASESEVEVSSDVRRGISVLRLFELVAWCVAIRRR